MGGWRARIVPPDAGLLLLGGVLMGLAHPPFGLLVPSFVALVPLVLWLERLDDADTAAARKGGFFFGLIYYTLVFYWLFVALVYYTWAAILAFLAPIIIMSFFLSWATGAYHACRRRSGWPVWLAFPVFWTANEWLRSNLPQVGFPWMGLGDTLTDFPWLIGAADVVGSRGLSFWLAMANAFVAVVVLRARAGRGDEAEAGEGPGAAVWKPAVGLALLILVPLGYSLVRWTGIETRPVATVGIVQPNVPEHLKTLERALANDSAMRAVETLTREWSAEDGIDLLLFPETMLQTYFEPLPSVAYGGDPRSLAWVSAVGSRLGTDVLVGAFGGRDLPPDSYDYYNSAFLVRPGQGMVARYDKRFLVPIVERVPFLPPRWFAGIPFMGAFGVGAWGEPLPVGGPGGASFGTMICYESIFSPLGRHYRREGAEFLVNITNDAWFGRDTWWSRSSALWQHPAHLVMRAIETRVGIARSANTGVSEIVDPLGRVSSATALFEPDAFIAEVETTDGLTFYVRFGDVLGWLSALAAIAGLGLAILRERRLRLPAEAARA